VHRRAESAIVAPLRTAIIALLFAASCDSAGGPPGHWILATTPDSGTRTSTAPRPRPDAGFRDTGPMIDPNCPMPTLASIREMTFMPKCATAGCHIDGMDPAKEMLDLSLPVDMLRPRLLRASNRSPSHLPLITPNQVGGSYLYLRVFSPMPVGGDRMPPRSVLPDCELDAIRDWIRAGAVD